MLGVTVKKSYHIEIEVIPDTNFVIFIFSRSHSMYEKSLDSAVTTFKSSLSLTNLNFYRRRSDDFQTPKGRSPKMLPRG